MVERTVSFNLNLNPGVSQLRNQMQGIVQISQTALLRIQHAEEQHALRMQLLRRKLHDIENNLLVSDVEEHRKSVKAIETEEERHALRMKQLRERSALQAQEQARRDAQQQGFNLSQAGHLAQALGFFRLGHLIRAAGGGGQGPLSNLITTSIGTRVGLRGGGGGGGLLGAAEEGAAGEVGGAAAGGAEAAAAGAGLGAIAAVAIPVAIALGGIYAVSKLVEAGFDGVVKVTQDFIAGVSQIGGAKSLQEMTVEAAENQRRSGIASLTVAPGERMTQKEIEQLAGSLSQEAELGGFDRSKWIQAVNEMGTVTGRQKSFDRQSWEFIGRLSNIGGVDPAEIAKVYGTLSYANPSMTNKDVQSLLLGGIGIGRELTFNVGELPMAGKVLQSGFKIAGDRSQALRTSMALAGLIKPFAPSGTLSEAGTMEEALLRQMTRVGIRGETPINVNRMGQVTNLNKSLGWILSTPQAQLPKALMERESGEAITALKAKFGIQEKDTPQQIQDKVDKMLDHLTSLGLSMGQLAKESEDITGVEQKLKARFNELANDLEGRLLKLLESDEFQKAFESIIDFLQANAPAIELAIETVISALNILAPAIFSATEAVADIIANLTSDPVFAMMFPKISEAAKDLATSLGNAKQQMELRDKFRGVEYPADFVGPLPPGARKAKPEEVSVPVVHRPDKPDPNTHHLQDIKTIQQKTHDVLLSIDKNIKEGGGKGFIPAPPRSHDGQ